MFSYFLMSVSHLSKVLGSFVIGLGGGLGISCKKFRMLSIGCILGLSVVTMCLKFDFLSFSISGLMACAMSKQVLACSLVTGTSFWRISRHFLHVKYGCPGMIPSLHAKSLLLWVGEIKGVFAVRRGDILKFGVGDMACVSCCFLLCNCFMCWDLNFSISGLCFGLEWLLLLLGLLFSLSLEICV